MLLAIDAGNTNIVFALYEGDRPVHIWRCQTMAGRTADEYAAWLYQLFSLEGLSFDKVKDAIIASVVPDANFHLQRLCRDSFGCEALMAGPDNIDLRIGLAQPDQAGADRLVNACAAIRDYGAPAIVVDFGTATTFDVVDGKGVFRGGVIAPGANLSMSALHEAAAKLPNITIKKPPSVIGGDTVTAMQSGVYWGYVGLIEGVLARLVREMNEKPRIIATGGLAGLFAGDIPAIEKVDADLTLRGLVYIYRDHRKNKKAA